MSENKTVKFIITRQDGPNTAPYQEEFEVPYRPNMNVISALMEIRRNPVNVKGQKNNTGCMGYELFRRSLRCLFNGDKWKTAPILFCLG